MALVWIMWMDVRLLVRGWRSKDQRYKSSFILAEYVHCVTRFITRSSDGQKTNFYLNTFYIPVGNGLNDGRTLRHAQARIFLHDDVAIIPVLGAKAGQVDIRHGEWAYFEIGKIVSENDKGLIDYQKLLWKMKRLKQYEHNVPKGFISFEISTYDGVRRTGVVHQPKHPHQWSVILIVPADDAIALKVRININMQNTTMPVSYETVA